ncbi:hypothetical protein ACLB1G_06370 [Oxalobacteraceae bacterium A2-2]
MRKHLLYLTSEALWAYKWNGRSLDQPLRFEQSRAGLDAFADYVAGKPIPCYLLADLIEEDFQRVQLPHVGGRAGRRLLARRLQQQYRETPYRQVQIQGRAQEGRRDDIALFSGLTNPTLVQPWVEILEQLRVPLAGLYSASMVSAGLLPRLGLRQPHLLLVTQHSAGLRQTYFRDGVLKFSRLTLAMDRDGQPVSVANETARTQQFLTSIRLLERGSVLHTAIVAPQALLAALDAQCADGPETAYQFIALEAACSAAGLDGPAPALADTILLHLLGRSQAATQYELGEARRYFLLWRLRRMLLLGSGILAACSVVWICANLGQYRADNADAERLQAERLRYEAAYAKAMAGIPVPPASTANMRAAVAMAQMLASQGPSPLGMLSAVSQALEQAPQIRLLGLDWKVDLPAPAAAPLNSVDGTGAAPLPALVAGIPVRPPQLLRLEAEVMEQADDYRRVTEIMNQFAQDLARRPRLSVAIVTPPLDTRPSAKLSARAGQQDSGSRPRFVLTVGWRP